MVELPSNAVLLVLMGIGLIILIVTIVHKYTGDNLNNSSNQIIDYESYGTNYSGYNKLTKLYNDADGDDPLKNASLNARIKVSTNKHSCSFTVDYDNEKNKRVVCDSGCFNNDENSKFCEKYIYNAEQNNSSDLDDIYEDAGGNDTSNVGILQSTINLSSGDNVCNFDIYYDGVNSRKITNRDEKKESSSPATGFCNKYIYETGKKKGKLWETLLDSTYVKRSLSSDIDKGVKIDN